ncbi:MAG: polyhydroxyalkanoate synthesis repressor PhaR [Pseudomonadota bacterium]
MTPSQSQQFGFRSSRNDGNEDKAIVCGPVGPAPDGRATQEAPMSKTPETTIVKKYANRRLYNTRTSVYVTLEDLAAMVRNGEEFVVQDAKTGEDITRGVLGQIIFDAESKGSGLLPIAFLRQLITLYDGQMHAVVPAYLEHSLASFAREQEKLSRQFNETGVQALSAVEDQVRRNMDMFQRSVRMFMPMVNEPAREQNADPLAKDVEVLRQQLAEMQDKVNALASTEGGEAAEHHEPPVSLAKP